MTACLGPLWSKWSRYIIYEAVYSHVRDFNEDSVRDKFCHPLKSTKESKESQNTDQPWGSRTTWRALFVKTPSDHSLVSMSIWPNSWCRGIALGFMVYGLTTLPILHSAALNILHRVDFPAPLGPTMTTPILWRNCSYSSKAFLI